MTDAWSYFLEFKGEQFALDGEDLTVGRSRTCDVSIKDPSVSRLHVRLDPGEGKIRLTDLGSSNGTFINGERITGGGMLADGDTLGLGDADIRIRVLQKAGFETVRMPQLEGGRLPEVGEATSILQKASMQLAKDTLGDDLEESQAQPARPAPAPPAAAGSHMAPPPPAADPPPATFAGAPPPAPPAERAASFGPPPSFEPPSFEPPPERDETSFAGLTDEEPDFGGLEVDAGPSFAPAPEPEFDASEPDFDAPDFSVLDGEPPESEAPTAGFEPVDAGSPLSTQAFTTLAPGETPKATIKLPTMPSPPGDEPEVKGFNIDPMDLPEIDIPEQLVARLKAPPRAPAPPPSPARPPAPVVPSSPVGPPAKPAPPAKRPPGPASMAEVEGAGDLTDVRQASSPAAGERAPQRSGDELLPSLDGFDTTLGPGTPIPESMLRAQESMAKVRAQSPEPPKIYDKPIQVPPMAGFGVRLGAALLDDVWMLALSAVGWLGLQELGAAAAGVTSLLVVLTGWAIWGTTPGKRLLGLYICTSDGQAGLGLGRAALRLFGYLVSTVLLGAGFLMILSSSKRGLHDRIADTYVRRFK